MANAQADIHHDGSHQGRAEAAAEPQASAEREQYPDDHHHAGIPL